MSFIRVTRKNSKTQVDLNSDHVIGFEELNGEGQGTVIYASDNLNYEVNESAKQIRGFIKRAQGLLPPREQPTTKIQQEG